MTADFSGRLLPIPPGIVEGPSFSGDMRRPCWVSQVASERLQSFGVPGPQAVVGGHTIWGATGKWPRSIAVSNPNRLGASEDIASLIAVAETSVDVWVEVDPYLLAHVDVPSPLRSVWSWPEAGGSLYQVGKRSRQAADAFRRRVRQVPETRLAVDDQSGRAVAIIAPLPGREVADRLEASGTQIDLLPFWESLIICWMGWWHTRRQIDQLAGALTAVIAGREPQPLDDDNFDRVPIDLPHRRMDTIWPEEDSVR